MLEGEEEKEIQASSGWNGHAQTLATGFRGNKLNKSSCESSFYNHLRAEGHDKCITSLSIATEGLLVP